jgi:hypothetical protein
MCTNSDMNPKFLAKIAAALAKMKLKGGGGGANVTKVETARRRSLLEVRLCTAFSCRLHTSYGSGLNAEVQLFLCQLYSSFLLFLETSSGSGRSAFKLSCQW